MSVQQKSFSIDSVGGSFAAGASQAAATPGLDQGKVVGGIGYVHTGLEQDANALSNGLRHNTDHFYDAGSDRGPAVGDSAEMGWNGADKYMKADKR